MRCTICDENEDANSLHRQTAEQCEKEMRMMSDGERGCAAPSEHHAFTPYTHENCPHQHIVGMRYGDDGKPANFWYCDDCKLRFYPACPVCVVVGHRNVQHPAGMVSWGEMTDIYAAALEVADTEFNPKTKKIT